jgi:hypothetical protein
VSADLIDDKRAARKAILDNIPPGDAHAFSARTRKEAMLTLFDADLAPRFEFKHGNGHHSSALDAQAAHLEAVVDNGAADVVATLRMVGAIVEHESAPGKRFEVVRVVDAVRVMVRRAGTDEPPLQTLIERLKPAP